jgi:hypothetical protein
MKEPSSLRDWAGPVLGVALGLSFGYILTGDGTTAGPAFFALLIVPLVIWMSPRHPLLGWQLPIVSFAVCSVLTHPEYPGQPFDLAADSVMIALEWAMLLLFSSLWGFFLLRRAQQPRSPGDQRLADVRPYALAVGLILLGGFLLIFGWILVFAPSTRAWQPAVGILVATIGFAAWKFCDRLASSLGKAHQVARHAMQLALFVCPLMAASGGHGGSRISEGWFPIIFGTLLGIESLAVLIWLSLAKSGTQAPLPQP